ncbi:MAG: ABC transporter substrate-binding protein [Caldibacillus sp.]
MKKIVRAFTAIFIVSIILIIWVNRLNASEGYTGENTITVFNWGDYIDMDLIKRFEEETGITVIYETFDSNEAMLTKIQQGGTSYDVAVPSEYAVERLKEEGLLYPLDHEKLPNLVNIDERFLDMPYDPGNQYSVPYFWGTVGIAYNTRILGDRTFESWNDLWAPDLRNQILLIDGAREVMGFGLNSLNYSLNDKNPEHLYEAKEKLKKLWPNIKAIVGDEMKMLLVNEEAPVAVTWSGDVSEAMWENEYIDYAVPKEGSNLWFDTMVIPKTADNIDGAHKFINFMLDAEVAAQNTDYIGYATPNKAAMELLDEEVVNDERFYPPDEITEKLEVYESLGKETLALYSELYLQFKMERK